AVADVLPYLADESGKAGRDVRNAVRVRTDLAGQFDADVDLSWRGGGDANAEAFEVFDREGLPFCLLVAMRIVFVRSPQGLHEESRREDDEKVSDGCACDPYHRASLHRAPPSVSSSVSGVAVRRSTSAARRW